MSLSVLVYASRATISFNDEMLKALLEKARENNGARNITGMLLFREGLFVQALEGQEEEIVRLFDKICKDKRHAEVIQIYLKPIQERSFPEWSMGFNRFDEKSGELIEGYTNFLSAATPEFFQGHPSYAKALLDNFRKDVLF